MKKRCLALFLSALLAVSLCVPAFAEELDSELTRVTLAVKKTLSIGDGYTNFIGNVNDMGALRYWTLDWSGDDGSGIHVTADHTGKVLQYSAGEAETVTPAGGYAPTLAKVTQAQALKSAQVFLAAVLTEGESAAPAADGAAYFRSEIYSFSGELLRGGVPLPDSVRLEVSRETGKVTSYWRDDCYRAYVNALPAALPAVSADKAASAFAGAAELELQYVLGEDGAAVLRYVPAASLNGFYVDAATGKLTDTADAWKDLSERGVGFTGSASAAAADESADKLSEAEQSAVEQMRGVQSKEALDVLIRKVTALGLSRYELASASYYADEDSGDVTCTLRYTRALSSGEIDASARGYTPANPTQTKTYTVNARTGALLEGWGGRPWYMKAVAPDRTKLQTAADDFLKAQYPDYAADVALTEGEGASFRYDRQVSGYFFHEDCVYIELDPADGSISSFWTAWTDDVTFTPVGTPVAAQQAKSAYCGAYAPVLRYVAVPVSVDTAVPIWRTYADCCGSVAYRYVLGYTWEQSGETILGVDAATGQVVRQAASAAAPAYTDIASSFAGNQIEALAAAGIRFGGSDVFRPGEALTEKSMLVLLLNSNGYSYDEMELGEDDENSLYESAWNEGFLPRGQRSPERVVTRLGLVKAILAASPYAEAAKLSGIYKTSFSDAKSIASADLGYAAIAQGLGMVRGDAQRRFQPGRVVTRQAAAAILCAYMDR